MKRTEPIAGYAVDTASVRACVANVVDSIKDEPLAAAPSSCRWLACMNPHSFAVALDDAAFSASLRDADWLVPDGSGVVLASKILGGEIRERVTGSDVFKGVMEGLNEAGPFKVFFLGSTPETLAAIERRMALDYPNLILAGTFSPPFKAEYSEAELTAMIDAINASSADVLWVGLTAPKQEKWIHQNRARLNVRFAGAIGAVFDFYTGRIKRSHPVYQKLGLEWLPRLLQEPRRLWRRMGVSAPIFLWHVSRQRFFQ
jgi:N-acetylglucosaminyldiphosphoundecaprenol N-acetyl-beta-D-mannosaminyltransferase